VRSWWGIAFIPFWLTIWALGWGFVAYGIIRTRSSPFEILWLIAWTAGGALAFSWWLWLVSGREVITIDGIRLRSRREVRGFTHERSYELARVHNLRFSPPVPPHGNWGEVLPLFMFDGSVAFDVDDQTERFGMYLDEKKSLALIREIRERFPSIE
jgi:hypothetical protein